MFCVNICEFKKTNIKLAEARGHLILLNLVITSLALKRGLLREGWGSDEIK